MSMKLTGRFGVSGGNYMELSFHKLLHIFFYFIIIHSNVNIKGWKILNSGIPGGWKGWIIFCVHSKILEHSLIACKLRIR